MLDNDIYVNHSELNISSLDEMYSHMARTLSFSGKTLKDAVLVLCAYSFYLSNEELSLLYHIYPAFTHLSARAFKPLIDNGYMVSERAASDKDMEGTARTLYALTKQGYELANSLCQGKITSKYKTLRSRIAKSHTYYIGYNFIGLMLLGFPITWEREFVYSGFVYGQRAKALQVDGKCVLYEKFGTKPFYTIYVEQDLGTEKNDILVGKFQNYASYGIMEDPLSSLILFSFSQKGVALKKSSKYTTIHPYNAAKLKKLINFMDELYLDDAFDAYLAGYPDNDFLISFLLKVNGAVEAKEGLRKTKHIITKAFIEEFAQLIVEKRNPYQQRDYNIQRASFSRARLEEMIALLYGHLDMDESFLIRLRRGFQIYYLPTTLIADRLKYAMPSRFNDVLLSLKASLSIFGDVSFNAELTNPLPLTKGLSLNLRNAFRTSHGDFFIEFPCFDVGAWIRAMHFKLKYIGDKPAHLVLVFETRQQVEDFYKASECYIDTYTKHDSQVLCIMLYDLGKTDKIFYIKDNSFKRHYITPLV